MVQNVVNIHSPVDTCQVLFLLGRPDPQRISRRPFTQRTSINKYIWPDQDVSIQKETSAHDLFGDVPDTMNAVCVHTRACIVKSSHMICRTGIVAAYPTPMGTDLSPQIRGMYLHLHIIFMNLMHKQATRVVTPFLFMALATIQPHSTNAQFKCGSVCSWGPSSTPSMILQLRVHRRYAMQCSGAILYAMYEWVCTYMHREAYSCVPCIYARVHAFMHRIARSQGFGLQLDDSIYWQQYVLIDWRCKCAARVTTSVCTHRHVCMYGWNM